MKTKAPPNPQIVFNGRWFNLIPKPRTVRINGEVKNLCPQASARVSYRGKALVIGVYASRRMQRVLLVHPRKPLEAGRWCSVDPKFLTGLDIAEVISQLQ